MTHAVLRIPNTCKNSILFWYFCMFSILPGSLYDFWHLSFFQKLGAIQELKLLDALNGYFLEHKSESTRCSMFMALFASIPDKDRREILGKLVSMAVGLKNKNLLDCAALWMQVIRPVQNMPLLFCLDVFVQYPRQNSSQTGQYMCLLIVS